MSNTLTPREFASEFVADALSRDAFIKQLLDSRLAPPEFSARDKAFIRRLAIGVISYQTVLDELIARYKKPGIRIKQNIKAILYCGLYEMFYMHTPVAVASDECIRLIKKRRQEAVSFANALLRSVSEGESSYFETLHAKDPADYTLQDCHVISGIPLWLLKRIKKSYTQDFLSIVRAHTSLPPTYVGVNPLCKDTFDALESAAMKPQPTVLPYTYCVEFGDTTQQKELVSSLDYVISDFSAQLVCRLACPESDSLMLEIGQGRGTKTIFFEEFSALEEKPAVVIGLDLYPYKTEVAAKRLQERWSVTTFSVAFDATKLGDTFIPACLQNEFDSIFCDVPCSGTGTLRRHPEIAARLDPVEFNSKNPGSLVALQQAILQAAAPKVKPGGYLYYSTCSIMIQENSKQIETFLQSETGQQFEVVPVSDMAYAKDFTSDAYEYVEQHETAEGYLQILPTQKGPDGHFLCILQRKEAV